MSTGKLSKIRTCEVYETLESSTSVSPGQSLLLASHPPKPGNPPSIPKKFKSVKFPEDKAQLAITLTSEGAEEWRIDPDTTNHFIVDAYAEACLRLNRPPLSSVIEQLSKVNVPLAKSKIPAIILKGTQLTTEDLEALEVVFKYCQTYHLSFENTNLNDKSLTSLLDALDYYVPCNELCFARNKSITTEGFAKITDFVSKYPQLTWLDLRGLRMDQARARNLSRALISQLDSARKFVRKFLSNCCGDEPVNPDSARDAETDPAAFRLLFSAFLSHDPTPAEVNTCSGALQCLAPLCLRGLHLGETGLFGAALFDVSSAIRMAGHLRDLRLPGNKLGAHDIELITPLLRYFPGLQVLDLSNNNLGDEGYRLLSYALSRPCYPTRTVKLSSEASDELQGNIRRLYLRATGLSSSGAKYLSSCLGTLSHLSHLELSDNPKLGCLGLLALRADLQAHTRRRLIYLGLADCGLACQGAIALAEVLADSPRVLRRIDLTGNHVAEAGLLAISKSIPLCPGLVQIQGLEDNRPIAKVSPPLQKSGTISLPIKNRISNNGSTNNGTPSKFAMFRLGKGPLSLSTDPTSPEAQEMSMWNRKKSTGKVFLLEPSPLSLDLLQTIHSQLASNVDKRLASRNGHQTHNVSSLQQSLRPRADEVRFFRGYARFPPSMSKIGSECDPRHLCGDTSGSDSGSESGSDVSYDFASLSPSAKRGVPRSDTAAEAQEAEESPPCAEDADLLRSDCIDD